MDWEARLRQLNLVQGPDQALQRGALLALLPMLTDDPRVLSLEVHGSLARGDGDAYSDIDLMVEVEPDRWPEFWAERDDWAGLPGDVAITLEHQWNAVTREFYYAAILSNQLYLDLGFRRGQARPGPGQARIWERNPGCEIPAADAAAPLALDLNPLDDTLRIFWCGASLAAKYLRRGDLWNALDFVQSRRSLILRAWRLVHVPEHADWEWHTARKDLPAYMLDRLAEAVPRFDPAEMAEALLITADLMAEIGPGLAQAGGVAYPERGAAAIHDWIRQTAATLRE